LGGESKKSLLNEEAGAKEDGGFQFFLTYGYFKNESRAAHFAVM
jgi:hypothetical protein